MLDSAGFEVLGEDECYELLAKTTLGRVGVTVDAMPAIFPICFALIDRQLVFSTGHGTKLTMALSAKVVAFEADWVADDRTTAWSVQGVGRSMLVEPGSDLETAAKLLVQALAPAPRPYMAKIRPTFISGRRLPPSASQVDMDREMDQHARSVLPFGQAIGLEGAPVGPARGSAL